MLDQPKATPRKDTPAAQAVPANVGEMLYPVPAAVRAGLRLDLRYVLRDAASRRAHALKGD